MTTLPTPPNGRFQHFGHALRHYRETVSDRLGRSDLPRMQVTAAALLKCVEQGGLVISQASYSDIENGLSLPRDPEQFLSAVAPCLAIKKDSLEWWTLVQYAIHGLVAQKLGEDIANEALVMNEEKIMQRIHDKVGRANARSEASTHRIHEE
jgi:hypothetical protein